MVKIHSLWILAGQLKAGYLGFTKRGQDQGGRASQERGLLTYEKEQRILSNYKVFLFLLRPEDVLLELVTSWSFLSMGSGD